MQRLLSLLCFEWLIGYSTCLAQPTLTDKMDQFMQAQVQVNHFNGNVLVASQGKPLYQKAFGWANYASKTPLTLTSQFDLASISKQFTAMSILLLTVQGKLHLSDSLTKFFPDLPYKGVTIQHLLTHTSGLPDYVSLMDSKWDHRKIAFNADMIRVLAREKTPALFQPGQKYKYSNTGYALLASIVEKASGETFTQFTTQNIFKPLAMNRSKVLITQRSSPTKLTDYAYGYVYSNRFNNYVLADSTATNRYVYYLDGIQGDGNVKSTVSDLLKWDRALKNHTLLPEKVQHEMLSGQVVSDSSTKTFYGYGVFIEQNEHGEVIRHTGHWPGYSNILVRYVADDLTVMVLSNNASNETAAISQSLVDIYFNKPVQLPQSKPNAPSPARRVMPVSTSVLDEYVGVYEGPFAGHPNVIFRIWREGDHLFERIEDGGRLAVFPETESRFFFETTSGELDFIRDSSGKVVKRTLKLGSYITEAKKIN